MKPEYNLKAAHATLREFTNQARHLILNWLELRGNASVKYLNFDPDLAMFIMSINASSLVGTLTLHPVYTTARFTN